MDLNRIITQIRTYAPIFQNRVAGAAQYAALASATQMLYPSGYVLAGADTATENESPNGLYQYVTEGFGVVIVLDNSTNIADRRGQTAVSQVGEIKEAVWAAILNWRYDPVYSARGIQYEGGDVIPTDDQARLFYQLDFSNTRIITEANGFIETYPDLTEIDIGIDINNDGTPDLTVDVTGLNDPA